MKIVNLQKAVSGSELEIESLGTKLAKLTEERNTLRVGARDLMLSSEDEVDGLKQEKSKATLEGETLASNLLREESKSQQLQGEVDELQVSSTWRQGWW